MTPKKKSIFVTDDGQNLMFTFILVSSLFLLWGFCNGMIDVMDKHFQEELGLSKSQSAWVQFAHYLGYFLMSLPAGVLASKLGYKGGIIAGLLIVAVGGFWFIPATHINAMVHDGTRLAHHRVRGFSGGRLRDRHRTDVSGNDRQPVHHGARRSALRRHAHQSGAILQRHRLDFRTDRGQHVFLRQGRAGASTGSQTLYIPYVGVAVVVIVLAVVFYFSHIPDIKAEDDYHLDDATPGRSQVDLGSSAFRDGGRGAVLLRSGAGRHLQLLHQLHDVGAARRFRSWDTNLASLGGTSGLLHDWLQGWFEVNKAGVLTMSNKGASNLASLGSICFLIGRFSGAGILRKYAAHKVVGIYALMNVFATLLVF